MVSQMCLTTYLARKIKMIRKEQEVETNLGSETGGTDELIMFRCYRCEAKSTTERKKGTSAHKLHCPVCGSANLELRRLL